MCPSSTSTVYCHVGGPPCSLKYLSAMLATFPSARPSRPVTHGVSVPARQAYSHCASVGSVRRFRESSRSQSSQVICSTGFRAVSTLPPDVVPALYWLGSSPPVRAFHWACVHSCLASKNGESVTSWTGDS